METYLLRLEKNDASRLDKLCQVTGWPKAKMLRHLIRKAELTAVQTTVAEVGAVAVPVDMGMGDE